MYFFALLSYIDSIIILLRVQIHFHLPQSAASSSFSYEENYESFTFTLTHSFRCHPYMVVSSRCALIPIMQLTTQCCFTYFFADGKTLLNKRPQQQQQQQHYDAVFDVERRITYWKY